MKTFILGGARSGKSRLAETLAQKSALPVTCIVTATAGDEEMRRRIERHRQERPAEWTVVEEPRALAARLQWHTAPGHCVIVDCLTLWISNLITMENGNYAHERDAFLSTLADLPGEVIFVSNETGLGIVPIGELTRRFCDEAGRLHQELAQHCDRVVFTVAGIPMTIKGEPL